MIFENQQVDAKLLPSVGSVDLRKLSVNYKTTEYIGTCILFTVLFVGALLFYFGSSAQLGVFRFGIFLVWALLFFLSLFLVNKRYELSGYAVREHDVIFKSGVWWQTVTTIPFNRMQHCEISQGPIQNAYGLATLRIFTAGGSSSDLAIDGLEHEEAKRIKEFITSKISGPSSSDLPPPAASAGPAWEPEEETIHPATQSNPHEPI
ncbi:MAG: PH domain-containing protein [Bacteroidota bacterium]